jgi:outer membrane protein
MNKNMLRKFVLLTLLAGGKIFSQGNVFTLQQALDFAYTHNGNQLNAELDAKNQQYYKRQIAGAGMPQINGSFDIKDYVNIPTVLIPASAFGGPAGQFIPAKFGLQWNAQASLTVTQLIFSSDYMVGLQAAKELVNLSEKNIQRTKSETAQNVSKAYYSVLVNRERIKLLDANIAKLKKMLDDTKAMNKAGFVENIDVDRLEVTFNNLVSEKEKVQRLIGLSETLLKFQMGYKVTDAITLSDSLSVNDQNPVTIAENQKTTYSLRPEYSLLETQQRLNHLQLKRYRLTALPTLVAYGNFAEQAQRTEFNFFDASQKWYPIGIVGATLNIPIFGGGQNANRIKQANISIQKTKNNLFNLEQAIDMEVQVANISYQNAITSLDIQKKNMALAKNVLEVTNKKYEQGVGSNIEIINAQTSFKEAETNYFNALYDMYVAKVDYLKAVGALVK